MKNKILTITAIMAVLAAGSSAIAQSTAERLYDLGTQDAIAGLQSLALQGGFQVFFPSELVKGRRIQEVRGRYEPQEALAIALRGSGLRFRLTPEGTYIIEEQSANEATSAPDTAQRGPDLEEIVISGTRIARPETSSPIPLVTYSARALEQSGETDVAKFLSSSPALVNSTLSRDVNARTDGQSNLNLRGLGNERTLVLVNGRRHVAGNTNSAAVDVNSIPTDLIERIDIVTGGTSAVYGADAVSGVVNFILKRDFEGLSARTQFGQSSRGDAEERFFSLLGGRNFADGRANVTVALEHAEYSPLFARDRRFRAQETAPYLDFGINAADDPDDPAIPDYIPLSDIRINNGALSGGFDTGSFDEDGNYLPGVFDDRADFTGAGDVFDHGTNDRGYMTSGGSGTPNITAYDSQIQAAEQRTLANVLASFEVSPALRLFAEGKFVHQESLTDFYLTYDVGAFISPENPFIPETIRDAIDPDAGLYLIERDNLDLGMPRSKGRPQTFQGVLGGSGRLSEDVTYEASLAFGQTKVRRRLLGDRYQDRFMAATDVIEDPDTGQPVCRSTLFPEAFPAEDWARLSFTPGAGSGCVPYDIFGDDVASDQAKRWVLFTSEISQKITQRVASVSFSGTLDSLFVPPAGSLGFAAGAEYRREAIELRPDANIQDGLGFADFGSGTQPQRGAYDVKEIFGELNVPLLSERRFVDELSLGLAARYSDYSTSGGDTTWNVNLVYGPTRKLRFRGAISRAVRAPNLIEAFSAPTVMRTFVDDPCDAGNFNNGTAFREDNCRTLLTGIGVDPDEFRPNDAQSGIPISAISRGNPDVNPETAKVWTTGVLLEDLPFNGLSVSLDWYDVDLTGAIDTMDPLTLCVDAPTLDNEYCAAITREVSGPNAGFIQTYLVQPTNVSAFGTSGLDVTMNYEFNTRVGQWNVRLVGGYLDGLTFASVEGADTFESAGLWGAPEYTVDADLTWTRGPLTLNYGVSWYSEMDVLDRETLEADPDFYPADFLKIGPRWKHDVQASFRYNDRLSVFASINNLTDEKPFPTSDSYPIDPIGRFFSVGVKASFP